jgi:hypothetical protein
MNDNEKLIEPRADKQTKRPYQAPTLILYGNIPEITKTVGRGSPVADNGVGSMDKTQ